MKKVITNNQIIAKYIEPRVNESIFLQFLKLNSFSIGEHDHLNNAIKGELYVGWGEEGYNVKSKPYKYPKTMRKLANKFVENFTVFIP